MEIDPMLPADLRKTFLLSLCAAVALGSCQPPEPPVSNAEALALAHRIERSIGKHDTTLLNRIFDEKALSQRVGEASGIFLSRSLISNAVKGIEKGGLGSKVVHAMGEQGTYQLIRQYEKEGRQHILFRLYGGEGINYHDYELVKRDEGVKAADLYVYTSGENISKTLANALVRLNKDATNKDLATTDNIRALMDQGDYDKAGAEYEKLPQNFKKEKAYQLMHVRILSHLSNEKYIGALTEYKSLFPQDPNMYLLMVDAYTLQKNYPMAMESVNKLDSLLGKDPFQDYERALIYKLMEDTAHEQLCLERLHRTMPDFSKGTDELIALYFSTRQPDKAKALLQGTR
jgi:tetratricopeptide (TPR) repeat protein